MQMEMRVKYYTFVLLCVRECERVGRERRERQREGDREERER